ADEGLFERSELRAVGQSLHRKHVSAVGLVGQRAAGADRIAVEKHGAGAAHLHVARALGAGQPESVAQHVEEEVLRVDAQAHRLAVQPELDLHPSPPFRRMRRIHASQYSSTKGSRYLRGARRAAYSRVSGRVLPSTCAMACTRLARSSVAAATTAHGTSRPTTRTP